MDAPQPVFRHLDDPDLPWQEVKRQRNADGTTSSVWEKWFAFRGDPPYLSLLGRYDPGMIVRRHGHRSPQVVYVIDGSMIPANLGVNPSLTITALAEHAMSHIPSKGSAP